MFPWTTSLNELKGLIQCQTFLMEITIPYNMIKIYLSMQNIVCFQKNKNHVRSTPYVRVGKDVQLFRPLFFHNSDPLAGCSYVILVIFKKKSSCRFHESLFCFVFSFVGWMDNHTTLAKIDCFTFLNLVLYLGILWGCGSNSNSKI